MMKEPIDAVITWVDGNDKAHKDKLFSYLESHHITKRPLEAAPTRYNQCGEIDFCIKSIFRFAPWIRNIYLVTDAQTPPIMKHFVGTPDEKRIKLVDHLDIFQGYEEVLPTFNSLTIESVLWRIKGLSKRFIYLNDDCALIRPVVFEDFFRGQKVVLRGRWRLQSKHKFKTLFVKPLARLSKQYQNQEKLDCFRIVQENSANRVGWNSHFFEFPHAPFPLIKKTFEDYFKTHKDVLAQNISYKIRSPKQFWPISFVEYLEFKENRAVLDNTLKTVTINGACHSFKKIKQRLSNALRNHHVAFVCMQSVDEAPIEIQTYLLNWLEERIC